MTDLDHIEEQAARWLVRRDRGLTDAQAETLQRWLAQTPAHRVAFLRLEDVWERADRIAALKSADLLEPREKAGYFEPTLGRLAAAAALIAMLCTGAVYYIMTPSDTSYSTAIGEQKSLRLADGSKVELNTNTQIHTKVSGNTRTVTIEHGQAYFEVIHDAKRPFVVFAGNRRIVDLGTKFSVLRDGNHVQVVVKEGRVRVDVLGGGSAVSTPVFADGGNVVVARADETLVAKRRSQEISDELNWRTGTLVFNQETLADAADEFNRYNTTHIVVEGDAREVRVGGSFNANNVDVFAALIQEGFGLSVQRKGNEIIISE